MWALSQKPTKGADGGGLLRSCGFIRKGLLMDGAVVGSGSRNSPVRPFGSFQTPFLERASSA